MASTTNCNIECYNALLSACSGSAFINATVVEKKNALICAIETLNRMRANKDPHCRPNSETYKFLLEAYGCLMDDWRSHQKKAIESTFTQCRDEGLVDDSVIQTLQRVAPYDLFRSMVLLKAKTFSTKATNQQYMSATLAWCHEEIQIMHHTLCLLWPRLQK